MGLMGIFALFVLASLIATAIGVVVWLAMLPGKIAAKREHPQVEAIRMAGWLGILTGIIWILAVIWAYTRVGAHPHDDGSKQKFTNLDERLALIEDRQPATTGESS